MLSEELMELVKRIQSRRYEEQTIEVKAAQGGCPRLYETLSSFFQPKYGRNHRVRIGRKTGI